MTRYKVTAKIEYEIDVADEDAAWEHAEDLDVWIDDVGHVYVDVQTVREATT